MGRRTSDNRPFEAKLAAFIRGELSRRGLSYEWVAAGLKISVKEVKSLLTVGLPERGNYRGWDALFMIDIAHLLGMTPEELVDRSGATA